jgi:hypothetical protein
MCVYIVCIDVLFCLRVLVLETPAAGVLNYDQEAMERQRLGIQYVISYITQVTRLGKTASVWSFQGEVGELPSKLKRLH